MNHELCEESRLTNPRSRRPGRRVPSPQPSPRSTTSYPLNMTYQYELKMKVRDYECDLQGIVNNANYQHYTEHCRHEFLLEHGVSFADLHDKGIDAVVARIAIDFKTPLRSRDEFVCRLRLEREGIKYVFFQDIYRLPDEKLVVKARVDTVCMLHGQLMRSCQELDDIFFPEQP